jgi:C1A family cysteine protease
LSGFDWESVDPHESPESETSEIAFQSCRILAIAVILGEEATMPKKVSFKDRLCNLVPSRQTETDWLFENAMQSGALAAPAAIPPSKDLRQGWWKINDQGSTGSCVGWASADGLVRYHMVQAARLDKNTLLSPRFVWMASKETDEFTTRPETFVEGAGTSLKAAMDICRKYGVVTDQLLPFKLQTLMFTGSENTLYATAAQRKIASYFNLGRNLQQWRTWIATQGPILAGLNVDAAWDAAAENQGKIDNYQPNTVRGGHAVCVVGYTKDRFIIRNSWGQAWGDKGFGYASDGYVNAAFFPESYGATL